MLFGAQCKADGHFRCRFAVTEASLLPLLSTLVTDVEFVVRQHLAEQFSGLSQV